ncbi:helicase-related protein, partial [Streptococcus suis]
AVEKLFDLLEFQTDRPLYHLSTNMCAQHRLDVIQEIKNQLKDDVPLICISTQLIEAGVDVDFERVVRSYAGLDSIVQAAGRCNREGKRDVGQVTLINLSK